MKRALVVAIAALSAMSTGYAVVHADQPGPGSTQCSPGQNNNPQPGFKLAGPNCPPY